MKKTNHKLLLGAHMSVAGGFEKAIERGESIECTAIQVFTKSNRQWAAKPISLSEGELFCATVRNSSIKAQNILSHASYLINIGSPESTTRQKSIYALVEELVRCEILGIHYLVLHPGSHTGSGQTACLQHITESLNAAFELFKGKTMVLLENMAGQGSVMCSDFEQLAHIRENINQKSRLGFCFDTCHAFAAGYDFRTEKSYESMWKEYDSTVGLSNLKAIHINDSKTDLGSHVDRHDEIGKGKIGLHAFEYLFNDSRFYDIPKILETPNDDLADYAKNMETIKSLISDETKKKLGLE